jgi:hypothetical protein
VPSWPLSSWGSRVFARLVVVWAFKFVHASYQRLLPSLCVVTARGTARHGCLAGASRCRQGPALLGRCRPQRAVDLSLQTATTTAPPSWPLAPLRVAVTLRGNRVAAWSRPHVALAHASLSFPAPSRVLCRDVLRAWGARGLSALRRDNVSAGGSSPFSARCHHAEGPLLRFIREWPPFFNSP